MNCHFGCPSYIFIHPNLCEFNIRALIRIPANDGRMLRERLFVSCLDYKQWKDIQSAQKKDTQWYSHLSNYL